MRGLRPVREVPLRLGERAAFEALERTLLIETNHPEILPYVRTVYARLRKPDADHGDDCDRGAIAQTDAGFAVTFNGERVSFVDSKRPTNPFRAAFYGSSKLFRLSFRRNPDYHSLYAAALRIDDRAVLIAAHAHTGKTTLTLELLARGARLYGDEFVFVRKRDREVSGFPRTLMVREPTLALVCNQRLNELCMSSPARHVFGHRVWDSVEAADVFGEDVYAEPAPFGAFVVLERAADGRARVGRLSPAVAAVKASPGFNIRKEGFFRIGDLAELLAAIPCYHLLAGGVGETGSALLSALRAE